VTDADRIRWLHLDAGDVVRLHGAVAAAVAPHAAVLAVWHYGSSARGVQARDIDIGLLVDRAAIGAVDVDSIAQAIADRCGRSVDEFDVRVVNEGDSVFLGNLMREGKRCFERDREKRIAFEVQAMNSWLDFQPAWDRLRCRVLEVWSRG
jgi:predicted nucleotidyltransferase